MIDASQPLPSSHEMERALLCAALNSPDFVLPLAYNRGLTEEWFHQRAHGLLWREILELSDNGKNVDVTILMQVLVDKKDGGISLLEACGGPANVSEIFIMSAVPAHVGHYIDVLKDKFYRREGLRSVNRFVEALSDAEKPVEEAIGEMEAILYALQSKRDGGGDLVQIKPHVNAAVDHIQAVYKNRGHVTDGLATGLTELDRCTQGLKAGDLMIIAARPAMGKSALAGAITECVGLGEGHYTEFRRESKGVAFISLEMSADQLVQRMLLGGAGVELGRLRDGYLSKADFPRITDRARKLMQSKIHIWDACDLSIQAIRAKMRRDVRQKEIKLICIDYLQLIKSNTKQAKQSREREVAEVSSGLKQMAKELGIPVIALAQLNRDVEKRAGGIPKMADLRECGAIEQDADIVGLLYRPSYYKPEKPSDWEGSQESWESSAILDLAKHRNGPVGQLPLKWTGSLTRFESETSRLASNNADERQSNHH